MATVDPKTELVIAAGARTAMAEYSGSPHGGAFATVSAIELAAHASRAAIERSKIPAKRIDHVVIGNALQTSADAIYGARHVGLKAGVPIETPALTVNRLCGSGLEAVAMAGRLIKLGEAECVLAGGMENMSQAPHVVRGARTGLRFGKPVVFEDLLFEALVDTHCGSAMGQTAERLGKKYEVSRADQDEFALRSINEAKRAIEAGILGEEIVPVEVKRGRKKVTVDTDDHLRPGTTLEALAGLSPAFGPEGTVTGGNASGIVDGAAAMIVTNAALAAGEGLPVLARVIGWATEGVDPSIMGIGPAPAIRSALKGAGIPIGEVDLFEINEAFAAQYLAVERELDLDRSKVNVNGGAIALGHPLGATGSRIILTLAMEMKRRGAGTGVASACIGGGQGIAVVLGAP